MVTVATRACFQSINIIEKGTKCFFLINDFLGGEFLSFWKKTLCHKLSFFTNKKIKK
jgi:hypothetical protein